MANKKADGEIRRLGDREQKPDWFLTSSSLFRESFNDQ